MSAEREEVIVDPDVFDAENVTPDFGQLFFERMLQRFLEPQHIDRQHCCGFG
jgi:hypothetical protein